ncbi:hypothetical protein ABVW88_00860, partial [Enterobacter cloacae subsp. cloacae]|uniref:hypothetical protein n=1 Tax=Enterobacter cloacae TaxID=550 RepID=UPI001C55820E
TISFSYRPGLIPLLNTRLYKRQNHIVDSFSQINRFALMLPLCILAGIVRAENKYGERCFK